MIRSDKTWWGRRFIEAVESFVEPKRLARGRQYLATHRNPDWRVERNVVEARVRGRISPYYGTYEEPLYESRIEFVPIPDEGWDQAVRHLGDKAGFVSRLLLNEMPDEIEQPLGDLDLSLLPRARKDLDTFCTCPEPDNPCKHVAGLFYSLASRLDQDPLLLFELRGLSRADLIRRLKETPLGGVLAAALTEEPGAIVPAASYFARPVPLAIPEQVSVKDFWCGHKKLPATLESPQSAPVSGILIKKGGDFPPFWPKDISFVEVMDGFYEQVRKKSKDWL
jgi:uncharacterized Zn finger protein